MKLFKFYEIAERGSMDGQEIKTKLERIVETVGRVTRSDYQRDSVEEFYEGFQQEEYIAPKDIPASFENLSADRRVLKMDLIAEEFKELVEAVFGEKSGKILGEAWEQVKEADEKNNDIVETADATADLKYVILGLEIETGIPSAEIFTEVHKSNMSKLGKDGKPVISDGSTGKPVGKVLKGEDWFEPDLKAIIEGKEPDRTPFIQK